MLPFYDVYGAIVAWLLNSEVETNARTGVRVKVGRGGTSFRLDLSDRMLPTIGFRKTFPKSAAAETAWYLQGSQDATFIRKYAPLWDKFVEPISFNAETADPKGVAPESLQFNKVLVQQIGDPEPGFFVQGLSFFEGVKAAYGYRWREHFGRDQIRLAVEALRKDKSDRRVYVSAWDPSEDGLGALGQKNVPCPVSFTFSVTNDELHSSIMLRSSDVFVGLPYDVMGHALLMDAMAQELRVSLGVMHVTLAHAHLYESHWDLAVEMMKQEPVLPALQLPGWSISQIERAPDDYVVRYAEEAKQLVWPTYCPRPEVIE